MYVFLRAPLDKTPVYDTPLAAAEALGSAIKWSPRPDASYRRYGISRAQSGHWHAFAVDTHSFVYYAGREE